MRFFTSILLVAGLVLGGCSVSSDPKTDQLTIVTSIAPIYSIVRQLTPDDVIVENIIPPTVSEHVWTASPADIQLLAKADIVVINGVLDQQLLPLVAALDHPPKVIDTSVYLTEERLEQLQFHTEAHSHTHENDEHEHEHEHDEEHEEESHEEEHHDHGSLDPHFWLSPTIAAEQATYIAQELAPYLTEENVLQVNLENLHQELSIIREEGKQLSYATAFMDFHPAYGYFYQEFGLEDHYKGSIQQVAGRTPTPRELQELYEIIRNEQVGILFTEPQFTAPYLSTLREEFPELRIGVLDPTGNTLARESLQQILRGLLLNFQE